MVRRVAPRKEFSDLSSEEETETAECYPHTMLQHENPLQTNNQETEDSTQHWDAEDSCNTLHAVPNWMSNQEYLQVSLSKTTLWILVTFRH